MRTVISSTLIAAFVSACGPLPDEVAGDVVSFTDTMVVIEAYGGFHPDDYRRPPAAMQENAQGLCKSRGRNAKFLSADLKDTGARTITGPLGITYIGGSEPLAPVQFRFACI